MAMEVPAKRPCGVVSSCGTSMVMHGELSPHRDLAISANPGGSTFHLLVGDGLSSQGATVGFDLPKLWAAMKRTPGMGPSVPAATLLSGTGRFC